MSTSSTTLSCLRRMLRAISRCRRSMNTWALIRPVAGSVRCRPWMRRLFSRRSWLRASSTAISSGSSMAMPICIAWVVQNVTGSRPARRARGRRRRRPPAPWPPAASRRAGRPGWRPTPRPRCWRRWSAPSPGPARVAPRRLDQQDGAGARRGRPPTAPPAAGASGANARAATPPDRNHSRAATTGGSARPSDVVPPRPARPQVQPGDAGERGLREVHEPDRQRVPAERRVAQRQARPAAPARWTGRPARNRCPAPARCAAPGAPVRARW
jgi:hypothetical protein